MASSAAPQAAVRIAGSVVARIGGRDRRVVARSGRGRAGRPAAEAGRRRAGCRARRRAAHRDIIARAVRRFAGPSPPPSGSRAEKGEPIWSQAAAWKPKAWIRPWKSGALSLMGRDERRAGFTVNLETDRQPRLRARTAWDLGPSSPAAPAPSSSRWIGAGPQLQQGLGVDRRAIALVRGEAVAGVAARPSPPSAGRGRSWPGSRPRRSTRQMAVAADHRLHRAGQREAVVAVHQGEGRRHRHRLDRPAHGQARGVQDVEARRSPPPRRSPRPRPPRGP